MAAAAVAAKSDLTPSPLIRACSAPTYSWEACNRIQDLVTAGASLLDVDARGRTPLHLVCAKRSPEGTMGVLITMMVNRAPLDAVDEDGMTPLHLACDAALETDVTNMVTHLVGSGAPLLARDRHGRTPMYLIFELATRLLARDDLNSVFLARALLAEMAHVLSPSAQLPGSRARGAGLEPPQ